ncbi:LppA family lipoprotein [Amycolatopsis sp. FU40]|uniref:LppA family lipoprotein n=1 Tax=Amycolatopsis sp. FU40 TaxID=2914159 RepID=UPI001F1BF221|nr:LppA family lipoprotein [Amycolatopsis sp. FU40]UKD56634.1 LppA family lipoprotein [Amycolatopsis sp. FU40]
MDQTTRQFDQFLQRPDIDQTTTRYEQLYGRIRGAIATAASGLKPWQINESGGRIGLRQRFRRRQRRLAHRRRGGQGPPELDGRRQHSRRQVAAHVRRSPVDLAAEYGFDTSQVTVDRPGDHEVVLRDKYEAELNVGTAANTTLLLRSGCHLTAAAKKRGAPAPRLTY